jgi:hypothetical protein
MIEKKITREITEVKTVEETIIELSSREILEIIKENVAQSTGKKVTAVQWDIESAADYDPDAWVGSAPIGRTNTIRKLTLKVE